MVVLRLAVVRPTRESCLDHRMQSAAVGQGRHQPQSSCVCCLRETLRACRPAVSPPSSLCARLWTVTPSSSARAVDSWARTTTTGFRARTPARASVRVPAPRESRLGPQNYGLLVTLFAPWTSMSRPYVISSPQSTRSRDSSRTREAQRGSCPRRPNRALNGRAAEGSAAWPQVGSGWHVAGSEQVCHRMSVRSPCLASPLHVRPWRYGRWRAGRRVPGPDAGPGRGRP